MHDPYFFITIYQENFIFKMYWSLTVRFGDREESIGSPRWCWSMRDLFGVSLSWRLMVLSWRLRLCGFEFNWGIVLRVKCHKDVKLPISSWHQLLPHLYQFVITCKLKQIALNDT
ncbi:hypothetical protein AQUCO_03600035v1 [Aquilegia coerulea]|uniref:Uncharacterized protein n=1 Tax=Aquilegia coerulea TaxID=218851 RepID=A0A2G5CUY2_AQUCA|nr:hypothetical protein AQUCO_03600035v1 [Aquilegia coerulea]